MSRVLIVEDSPTQAQQLEFLLEDAGYQVEIAANGHEAFAALEKRPPDIVVTDLEMPEINGLKLVESVRASHPAIPVILMTAYGSEEIAALALQKGAASYVPKKYLNQDIVATVGDVLSVATAHRDQERVRDVLTQVDMQFVLDNDTSLIPPLIGYLEEPITKMGLCDQTGLIRVCVALREGLINAIHHGNLEAGSDLRENSDRDYHEMVEKRRRTEPYSRRRVFLNASISYRRAEFTIRDEGPGFDPSQLPDPTDPANLEKVSGRGLLLIRTFMDQVHHNEEGNAITMVKWGDLPS
jgi:CheY-like chemotaxis protein